MVQYLPAAALAVILIVWLAVHFSAKKKPAPRCMLGIVSHNFTAAEAAQCLAMGILSVRIPWYGDNDADNQHLDEELTIAEAHALHVIVVANAPLTDTFANLVRRRADIQVENEPTDLVAYAARFVAARALYKDLSLMPAGLSNSTGSVELKAALAAGLGVADVLCLHVYGNPLENAVADRLGIAALAGWTKQIIFTEIGAYTAMGEQLIEALNKVPPDITSYVYDLDGTDGFAINADTQRALAQFTGAAK